MPSGLICSGFLAQQEPSRAALYRLVPCSPVPIPVPKLLALFCRVFGHRWEVNDAYAARALSGGRSLTIPLLACCMPSVGIGRVLILTLFKCCVLTSDRSPSMPVVANWLKPWKWLTWFSAPQCGDVMHHTVDGTDGSLPHCGSEPPHCGDTAVHRPEDALSSIELAWQRAAELPRRREPLRSPEDLALRFRQCMQSHPALVGMGIYATWTRRAYPIFCEAEGVDWPPPYKDFARALKEVMPKKRSDKLLEGKRATAIYYRVPDPSAAVVDLALEKKSGGRDRVSLPTRWSRSPRLPDKAKLLFSRETDADGLDVPPDNRCHSGRPLV